jgi:DNA modification methylase
MPQIPSNSIDIIITSPPYNIDLGTSKNKKEGYEEHNDNMPYDKYLDWMNDFFYECNRVLKIGGRFCINIADAANGQIPTHADFSYLIRKVGVWKYKQQNPDIVPFQTITTIVWDKLQIGNSCSWGSFKNPVQPSFPTQFEFILIFGKGTTRHEGDSSKITVSNKDFIENSRALWKFAPESQMIKKFDHPAVFPEDLPRRLIEQLTYADDIVLDPFSGSGTTCVVAKQMKRHYIGMEMTKKYYKKSIERLFGTPYTESIEINGQKVEIPSWIIE